MKKNIKKVLRKIIFSNESKIKSPKQNSKKSSNKFKKAVINIIKILKYIFRAGLFSFLLVSCLIFINLFLGVHLPFELYRGLGLLLTIGYCLFMKVIDYYLIKNSKINNKILINNKNRNNNIKSRKVS